MEGFKESTFRSESDHFPDFSLNPEFHSRLIEAVKQKNHEEFRDEEVDKFEKLMRYMEGGK